MAHRPRLAVLMDPIGSINPAKDSTLAMMLAAQKRGVDLSCFEQRDLWVRDGRAMARLRPVTVRDDLKDWYSLGEPAVTALADVDVVLMRKDPPFDTEYIYTTYLLERAEADGVLVVNRPAALRDVNEKFYTAWFPQCTPPTLVSRRAAELRAFLAEHGDVVLKRLDLMGGTSVFRLRAGDVNTSVVIETLTEHESRLIMAQRFIPEIAQGDKRILLVDGEPVPYALARIPTGGDFRGNLAAGGRGEGVALSDHDRWICQEVGPRLRALGILFAGIDVIGDWLSEINVTSPTCIRELDKLYGLNIAAQLLDAVAAKLGSE
jgi:glutathione synthase